MFTLHSHRLVHLSLGLALSLLPACREKKPQATAPPPATPKAAEAVKTDTPPPVDDDPLNWPIIVKVGPDGHALPVKTSSLRARDDRGNMAHHPLQWFTGETGRYIQAQSPYFRQPFKTIDRGPGPRKAGGGGGRSHEVKPNGARSEFDADSGSFWNWDAEGNATVWNPTEGTITNRDPEGNVTQNDGFGGDTFTHGADGSFDSQNADGSGAHLFPPGQPGEGGALGYTYGPDGPSGERSYFYDDGGSVDLPDPLSGNSSGPGGDRLASGAGEPHYLTRDGTGYTTQAAGEFILVTGVSGREIQARHTPWKESESFSAITAMAFRVGDSKIEVRLDGTVLLDGIPAPAGQLVQGDIPGGGALGVWRKAGAMAAAVVLWPDLSAIWITPRNGWLDFHLQWRGDAPEHRGLLGSNDNDPANDLTSRDGTLASATDEAALKSFVHSWRITHDESLFTYEDGQSTDTFTLLDFPKHIPEALHTALAEECCGHLPEGFAKDRCIYDVSMTGDRSFADSYSDLARRHKGFPQPSTTSKRSAAKAALLQVTEDEATKATQIEPDATVKETLAAGESKVLRFTVVDEISAPVAIFSEQLAPGTKYSPERAGYALFNDKREPIGDSTAAEAELNFDRLQPGTYYLKITGPGLIHIKLH